jgi:O-antigen/teichoic acid export membrane protein
MKSNRLAVSFGLPFGIGLALFAEPLIDDVLGARWRPALGLIQVFAVIAAVDQLGFNWTAFYRALGRTRPIAVVNVTMMVVFLGVAIPLLLARGLDGLAIGMAVTTASGLVLRWLFIHRLFGGAPLVREAARAAVPTVLGALAVLAIAHNLVLYLAVVAAATWLLQASLLREAVGYLARRTSAQAEPITRPA